MTFDPRSVLNYILSSFIISTVLFVDVATRADDISICFAYTLPILISAYTGKWSAFLLAACSTAASIGGSFIRLPVEGMTAVFVVNRVIAIATQWLIAFLIEQQKKERETVQRHLVSEGLKFETGQRFLQILTHEIATSLTSIDGQSYRLGKLAHRIGPSEIIVRTEKIRQAASRLEALISKIRTMADVEQGTMEVNKEALDVGELLSTLQSEFTGESGASEIRCEVRCKDLALYGDWDLIYQSLSNLLSNALKYSAAPGRISVVVSNSNRLDGAMIEVADRGVGISSDELTRVSEPYYRARNSGGVQGIGIGLYLVKRYVEAHNGLLEIESSIGIGTTVRLHLPSATHA